MKSSAESRCDDANCIVVGAVHGLLCSTYDDRDANIEIKVWNPSLSAGSTLPPSLTKPSNQLNEFVIRFGRDPQSDDYKVVKFSGTPWAEKLSTTDGNITYSYSIQKWDPVEVYSLRKGSWEVITARIPPHWKLLTDMDQISVDGHDGHIHWNCLGSQGGRIYLDSIATFDLSSHTFGEIRFPDSSALNHQNYINVIGVWGGKLCMMLRGDKDACGDAFEGWVMEEYGVSESWDKRHEFTLGLSYARPFGFTTHGEILIQHRRGYLLLYNPCGRKTKYYKKYCCLWRYDPYKSVEFVDSLVWVAPPQDEMVDDAGQS